MTYIWNLKNKLVDIAKKKQTQRSREIGVKERRGKGGGKHSGGGQGETKYYVKNKLQGDTV